MKVEKHIIASAAISGLAWLYFKSVGYAFISFLAGTCIDADHFIDYYSSHSFTFDLRKIYRECYLVNLKRLYLVLHSYELAMLLWAATALFGLGNFWKAVSIGLTQHLIFDQLTNPLVGPGYFFLYRMSKGFERNRLLKGVQQW